MQNIMVIRLQIWIQLPYAKYHGDHLKFEYS